MECAILVSIYVPNYGGHRQIGSCQYPKETNNKIKERNQRTRTPDAFATPKHPGEKLAC